MIYNRLIVAAIGFIRLEPYDGKLSRTVLRGGKDSNALLLPDYASVEMLYHPEYTGKPCHLYYEFDKWFMERKSA